MWAVYTYAGFGGQVPCGAELQVQVMTGLQKRFNLLHSQT